ncbi:metacaspase 3 [Striga asiatica]|uniref:Metacaspase 3 n=1 Tax=Striga asiatica TaxID=4170 RepID=A0A5A7RAB1_STRAF|nr:metacaspase 3 [Striga asiatica]
MPPASTHTQHAAVSGPPLSSRRVATVRLLVASTTARLRPPPRNCNPARRLASVHKHISSSSSAAASHRRLPSKLKTKKVPVVRVHRNMSNDLLIVQYNGEWINEVSYDGYEVCGVFHKESESLDDLEEAVEKNNKKRFI